ncbi:VC0807 family protein [Microbispora bryophytorum]|uniref:VC0807 family protein n=1 Tax=Microbispora bryophytorum TaxID=1460882 RepID=UPI0033F8392D
MTRDRARPRLAAFTPLLLDVVVPVAAYYALRLAGLNAVLSLVFAAVPTAGFLMYQAVRRRRLDALGAFVLALLAVGAATSLLTGSPEFLLAKSGWLTAAIGIGFLVTLGFAQPLAFTFARSMLRRNRLGASLRVESWDVLWLSDGRFRRIWRNVTVLWGAGLLVDAGVRVALAYTLPVDLVPGLGVLVWAVTFAALQLLQFHYFASAGLWSIVQTGGDVHEDR